MKRHALLLTIMMLVSKVFGFVRESVLSFYYGRTPFADIYFTANLVPQVFLGFIAGGLASTFIPIYSRVIHREGEKKANLFMDNVLTILLVFGFIFGVVGLFFAEPILKIMAPGFSQQTHMTAIPFVQVAMISIMFNASLAILQGYHQYHERFLVTPFSGLLSNVIIITFIIISTKTKPILLALGITVSSLTQLLFMYIAARKKGQYKLKMHINFKDQYFQTMVKMAIPIILGASINQVNTLVDRNIASSIEPGAISTLNYASRISDSVYQLFVITIVTVMYPTLTKQASRGDYGQLRETVNNIMNTVILIVIPASVGIIVLSKPIIHMFYGRGEFMNDPRSVLITAQVMALYAVGNVGYGLRDVLVRSFYALHDSVTPVVSGVVAVIINIILNLVFTKYFGLAGVALATSVSAIISAVMIYVALYYKIDGIPIKTFLLSSLKVIFASVIMGLGAYGVNNYLMSQSVHYLLSLMISAGVGVIIYIVIMHFMRVKEFDDVMEQIRTRLGKKFT